MAWASSKAARKAVRDGKRGNSNEETTKGNHVPQEKHAEHAEAYPDLSGKL
jgi:hypothetical protein